MDRKSPFIFTITLLICTAAVLVYLVHEPAREIVTWSKWFFGRLFLETGEFLVPGRSPLYAIYTSLFLPLGYPQGPMVTRLLDTAFIYSGLFVLFRPYTGRVAGLICALIWVPGVLSLGAAVDGLGLSSLFWAFALRRPPATRGRLSVSYAFMILAGLFRPNYLMVPFLFAIYDMTRLIRASSVSALIPVVRPRIIDLPIALLVAAFVWFSAHQSDHKWNNGWNIDLDWFGTGASSVTMAVQIGSLVHWTIIDKHGSDFENHDIYFVVKEEFGEVNSPLDLLARYDLILGNVYSNKQYLHIIAMHTDFGRMLIHGATAIGSHKFAYPVFFAVLLFGMIGFYNNEKSKKVKKYYLEILIIEIILTIPLLLLIPTTRYTLYFIPMFAAAAFWYGQRLVSGMTILNRLAPRYRKSTKSFLLLVPFVLFSNFYTRTASVLDGVWEKEAWQRPYLVKEVFEGRFNEIADKISNCRGIMMTDRPTVFAPFTDIPLDRFYSIYEIPPFGRHGDGGYKGLYPERIDCVFVSYAAVKPNRTTFATARSRYLDYIVPYTEVLKTRGAMTYRFDVGEGIELTVLR